MSLSVFHHFTNSQMTFGKLQIWLKIENFAKITKCWFLWQFLWHISLFLILKYIVYKFHACTNVFKKMRYLGDTFFHPPPDECWSNQLFTSSKKNKSVFSAYSHSFCFGKCLIHIDTQLYWIKFLFRFRNLSAE